MARPAGRSPSRIIAALLVTGATLLVRPASAHPAGTSSINRYLNVAYAGAGRFRIAYLLDFAEAPAYAEIDALDADHDGAVTPEEQRQYLAARLPPIVAQWIVEADGERMRPVVVASHLQTSPGEGGLDTLRIECELAAIGRAPPPGRDFTLRVRDETFVDHPGWRELTARGDSIGAATSPLVNATEIDQGAVPAPSPHVLGATFVLHAASRSEAGGAPDTTPRKPWIGLFAAAVGSLVVVVLARVRRR